MSHPYLNSVGPLLIAILSSRRLLLIAYDTGGFTVFDCSKLDCWREILNIPTVSSMTVDLGCSGLLPNNRPREFVAATVLPTPLSSSSESAGSWSDSGPLVAVTTQEPDSVKSQVLLFSLRLHTVVHVFEVEGKAHRIVRFIVTTVVWRC